MWRTNAKIGFDDRLVTAIMIPIASFFIPVIFFGMSFNKAPYYTWEVYSHTLFITTLLWLGNRLIMIKSRSRYPHFADTQKRLLVQSAIMIIYTVIVDNLLGYLLDVCGIRHFHANMSHYSIGDVLIMSNAAALFCLLTVVAIYEGIYFKNELQKSIEEKEMFKRESLHAQLNALKAQVNPHFLFNNLNTLVSIIPEDSKRAVDFVQQLARVYRHILEVRDEKSIPLKEELDVLKAYSFLLKTRFGDNLSITMNVPEDKINKNIIPLSLQILLENAIKHNIVSSEKPLKVDVFAENGKLVVTNNLQKKNQLYESTGIGLENLRNRYRLISDRLVEVNESNSNFTVSIPLIEP
jgi:two-component system, LytTR family, sensor kinase